MIPEKYSAPDIEKKWRAKWQEWGLHRWDPAQGRAETFAVDSPPPTVSGSLHVGHVFSYTHQDFIARYRRMKGMNIFYPMGWDDNGLPTERRVQNFFNVRCDPYLPYQPGLKPKNEKKAPAERISRLNFIELCRQVTRTDEEAFRQLWQHLGLSIDWEQEYATIDTLSRKTSQLSFLKLFEEGEVYQLETPTLWDVDFQTAVAQAEVEDRMMPGAFHHLRFGIEGGGDFIIATTRPELLAACVAVVAHPDDSRYTPFFGKRAVTPLFRMPVPILPDRRADPEKGTGILMVCTFGDQTDVEWWREFKLPLRQILGRDGRLLSIPFGTSNWESLQPEWANQFYSNLAGKRIKQARAAIVELLRKEEGAAIKGSGPPLTAEPQPIQHSVKQYEKGDQPLEIMTTRQWFIKLLDKKEALMAQGSKIQWHPAYMRARYESWVQGLNQDWCISRQRYFGVPFPVWYPLDHQGRICYEKPILASEGQWPVDPLAQPPPGFEESQRGKPGGFAGDPDVMDTWATSSMTPQIASRWAEDPVRHQKLFPMDMRPQSHEIIRTWAFYTIAKAYLHEREIPWRHVVISGWILDPDRKKMSKSQGNVVTPNHLLDQYSSDAVRYWAARARLGVDTAYDEAVFGNGKRLITKLYNAVRFVSHHFKMVDFASLSMKQIQAPLDRGFILKLREVTREAGEVFETFEFAQALQVTESFFWADFCDNYLELIKGRCYEKELTPGRLSALASLKISVSILLRLFAPYIPFFTEEAWSWLYAATEGPGRSIHTSPWPTESELGGVTAPEVHDPYGTAVEVLTEVRKVKGEAKLSMKAPLKSLQIVGANSDLKAVQSVTADLVAVSGAPRIDLQEGPPEQGRFKVKIELPLSSS